MATATLTDPASHKPTNTFAQAREAEPHAAADLNSFKMVLSSNGVQLGYLGKDGSGWAVLVKDAGSAVTLEQYPYNGVTYYRIKGSSSYMSVSNNAYIGFYNWLGATGFTKSGSQLISDNNKQPLSLYSVDNAYIYAWKEYTILDVSFQ
jgi:hypothetical protein